MTILMISTILGVSAKNVIIAKTKKISQNVVKEQFPITTTEAWVMEADHNLINVI